MLLIFCLVLSHGHLYIAVVSHLMLTSAITKFPSGAADLLPFFAADYHHASAVLLIEMLSVVPSPLAVAELCLLFTKLLQRVYFYFDSVHILVTLLKFYASSV